MLEALHAAPPTGIHSVSPGSNAEGQLRSYTRADGRLHWSKLPRFSSQWRDVYDILKARRDWDGVHVKAARGHAVASEPGSSGADYYLRFCGFSAALLKVTKGKGELHPVCVFYACRDVLEQKRAPYTPSPAHRLSQEHARALDIRVVAAWIRDGGQTPWETNRKELQQHWGPAITEKTDMRPRKDGLPRERWGLREKRLRTVTTEVSDLNEETRAVVTEAADVIGALLEGHPNT